MSIETFDGAAFEFTVPVLVAGGGACGLTAALAAAEAGAQVLVLERDPVPLGTTAMSSGLIPAAGTRAQRAAGITDDSPERFADDLVDKVGNALDRERALHVCAQSTVTVDWLIDVHHLPLTLFEAAGSLPGHSRSRLHGTPNRTGEELMASLQDAVIAAGGDIMTDARVSALIVDDVRRVRGVKVDRPDGSVERIGCDTLILATCGYAASERLIARHIPEIQAAVTHTHPASRGDALAWGEAMGAATGDLTGYQGHGNLAAGHGLLVSWLSITEGGFQVNAGGERFSDEGLGYSEQATHVAAQPDAFAWTIYDQRVHAVMTPIAEYRDVVAAGALRHADDIADLAEQIRVPEDILAREFALIDAAIESGEPDRFGRRFIPTRRLAPPFVAVKVNGALFHTQGGLEVDHDARVMATDGTTFPNLFAGGGAARGLSGPTAAGYVAGNGLMTATTLGRLAGQAAAQQVLSLHNGSRPA